MCVGVSGEHVCMGCRCVGVCVCMGWCRGARAWGVRGMYVHAGSGGVGCMCVCVGGCTWGGCLCMCACAEARPTGPTLLWQSQPGANAPRHGWRGLPVPVLTLGAR